MSGAVKDMALTPVADAAATETDALVRAAMDPNVDTAKLEALINMRERVMKIQAKAAFDAAFAAMQPEIPEIDERGKLIVKGQLRSTYARLEDIHAAIKPVLAAHGFAIRHRTEWPEGKANTIRIVGILGHREGHSEESVFEAPMDRSEYRSDIQSMGSTVSYGRRYTTLDLLNLTTRGLDDDARPRTAPAPVGFDEWLSRLRDTAKEGLPVLQAFWRESAREFRDYLNTHQSEAWNEIKKQAAKAGAQ